MELDRARENEKTEARVHTALFVRLQELCISDLSAILMPVAFALAR